MRNNYYSLKCYNNYSLVREIIFKINVFLNIQTFHGHIHEHIYIYDNYKNKKS